MIKGIFYEDWNTNFIPLIIKEIYLEGIYDPYKKDGAVVLDIGANVGLFTHFAYPFASKIYAVEPAKDHFETLNQMLTFNQMTDKVTPIKCAIDNKVDKIKLYHAPGNSTMNSLEKIVSNNDSDSEEVETETLKSLMDKYKIDHVDLAKVDVEGAEMRIFADSSFDEVAPKIDTIFVEWHSWTYMNKYLLVSSLKDRGYKVKPLDTNATVFVATRI